MLVPSPIEITFYDDYLTWVYPRRSAPGTGGVDVFNRECYTLNYSKITKVRYDIAFHRVAVHGIVNAVYYRWKGDTLSVEPSFQKRTTAAVTAGLQDYQSEAEAERVLAAITKFTGKRIERYGLKTNRCHTTVPD